MAESRRVIVELRHSQGRQTAFARMRASADAPHLDSGLVPDLDLINWDQEFPLVELPALRPTAESSDPFDIGLRMAVDQDPGNSTYMARGTVDDDQLDALLAAAEASTVIVGVYADVAVQPTLICPGDPPLGSDSDVERLLCVPKLRELGMDGTGILVAIVDTGINMEYLRAHGKNPNFDAVRSWVPRAGLTPGELPVDHGTMCAYDACIAAPNCTLLDIALLLTRRTGGSIMEGFLSDAVLAYRHLIDIMLADRRPGECRSLVVNNSWGMFHPSWDFPVGHEGNYSDNANHPFNRIVGTLERAGADILFAAGNCGPDCPDGRCQGVTANAIYGANSHPQVLSIAGVDTTKNRVGYSSVGPGRLERQKPDLASYTHFRGSGVYPADGGTSAATPVAAGLVAAIRSRNPFDPARPATAPVAIRNLLIKTAEDRGLTGYDFEYGWGIVNGCRIAELEGKDDGGKCCEECCRECCKKCCGCGGGGDRPCADLVPVPDARGSFCRREGDKLLVEVKNQGTCPAGRSTTLVDFGQHGSVEIPTPALAAGSSATLLVDIPRGCHDPDCEFKLAVDVKNDVAETNEANNSAGGVCIG